ncbi:hypothetical protein C8Q74DRAFT_106076 [Fomes fomentarius]|nr:hypothetical protein C8Q74DRAFT_106076 [Fomes fomentarius]
MYRVSRSSLDSRLSTSFYHETTNNLQNGNFEHARTATDPHSHAHAPQSASGSFFSSLLSGARSRAITGAEANDDQATDVGAHRNRHGQWVLQSPHCSITESLSVCQTLSAERTCHHYRIVGPGGSCPKRANAIQKPNDSCIYVRQQRPRERTCTNLLRTFRPSQPEARSEK